MYKIWGRGLIKYDFLSVKFGWIIPYLTDNYITITHVTE